MIRDALASLAESALLISGPEMELKDRDFQDSFQGLVFERALDEAARNKKAERMVIDYIKMRLAVESSAVREVVVARDSRLGTDQLAELWEAVRPSIEAVRAFLFRQFQGTPIGIGPGILVAIDWTYASVDKLERGKLALLASATPPDEEPSSTEKIATDEKVDFTGLGCDQATELHISRLWHA